MFVVALAREHETPQVERIRVVRLDAVRVAQLLQGRGIVALAEAHVAGLVVSLEDQVAQGGGTLLARLDDVRLVEQRLG